MKWIKFVIVSTALSLIYACSHPIEIVGEGDVMSGSGYRDCSLEQFIALDDACSKNYAIGAYRETYYAEPRENWMFDHWGSYCTDAADNSCSFDVPANAVQQAWGGAVPALQAVFVPATGVQFTLEGEVTEVFPNYWEGGDRVVGQRVVLTSTYSGTITGVGREVLKIGFKGMLDPIFGEWQPGFLERPEGLVGICSPPPDFLPVACSYASDQMDRTGQLIFQDGELVGVFVQTDDEGRSEGDLDIIYPGYDGSNPSYPEPLETDGMGRWLPGTLSPYPIVD